MRDDCPFSDIAVDIVEFTRFWKYSVAYHTEPHLLRWYLNSIDEITLERLCEFCDIESDSDDVLRRELINKYFHRKRAAIGFAPFYRRWFETNPRGVRALRIIDERLFDIFEGFLYDDEDMFGPSNERERAIIGIGGEDEIVMVPRPVMKYAIVCKTREIELVTDDCPVCLEVISADSCIQLNCSHSTCTECITGIFKTARGSGPRCPLCRTDINQLEFQDTEKNTAFCREFIEM
jgi:hypothetical protein